MPHILLTQLKPSKMWANSTNLGHICGAGALLFTIVCFGCLPHRLVFSLVQIPVQNNTKDVGRLWGCPQSFCNSNRWFPMADGPLSSVSLLTMDEEMDINEAAADDIQNIWTSQIKPKVRNNYRRSGAHFILWLLKNHIMLLNFAFIVSSGIDVDPTVNTVMATYQPLQVSIPPLIFNSLTADVFVNWLRTLRKPDGNPPGIGTFNGHRSSGLFNLFRDYEQEFPTTLAARMKGLFRGLKVIKNTETHQGLTNIRVGKLPMSFQVYNWLGDFMLPQPGTEYIFAHTMMTLSWNLMCQVGSSTIKAALPIAQAVKVVFFR